MAKEIPTYSLAFRIGYFFFSYPAIVGNESVPKEISDIQMIARPGIIINTFHRFDFSFFYIHLYPKSVDSFLVLIIINPDIPKSYLNIPVIQ